MHAQKIYSHFHPHAHLIVLVTALVVVLALIGQGSVQKNVPHQTQPAIDLAALNRAELQRDTIVSLGASGAISNTATAFTGSSPTTDLTALRQQVVSGQSAGKVVVTKSEDGIHVDNAIHTPGQILGHLLKYLYQSVGTY